MLADSNPQADLQDIEDLIAEYDVDDDPRAHFGDMNLTNDRQGDWRRRGSATMTESEVATAVEGMDVELRDLIAYREGDYPGSVAIDMVNTVGPRLVRFVQSHDFKNCKWLLNYLLAYACSITFIRDMMSPERGEQLSPRARSQMKISMDLMAGAMQYGLTWMTKEMDETVRSQLMLTAPRGVISGTRSKRLHRLSSSMARISGKTDATPDAAGLSMDPKNK